MAERVNYKYNRPNQRNSNCYQQADRWNSISSYYLCPSHIGLHVYVKYVHNIIHNSPLYTLMLTMLNRTIKNCNSSYSVGAIDYGLNVIISKKNIRAFRALMFQDTLFVICLVTKGTPKTTKMRLVIHRGTLAILESFRLTLIRNQLIVAE